MEPTDAERSALLKELLGFEKVKQAPQQRRLLQILFDNRDSSEGVPEAVLAQKLGQSGEPGIVRRLVGYARKSVAEFAISPKGAAQKWQLEIPRGERHSYRIDFHLQEDLSCEQFWQAHLAANETELPMLCSEPLIFWNQSSLREIRFFDIHIDIPTRGSALAELKARYPLEKDLEPAFPYLLTGEVEACDAIRDWFTGRAVKPVRKIARRMSRHGKDLNDEPMVILGHPTWNSFMKRHFNTCTHHGFRYGYSPANPSITEIRNPSPDEVEALGTLPGMTGYVTLPAERGVLTLTDNLYSEGHGFAIVTRLKTETEGPPVTMLSSFSSRAIEQVGNVLTHENSFRKIINRKTARRFAGVFPQSFQMLFYVPMPPEVESSAHTPKLIAVSGE